MSIQDLKSIRDAIYDWASLQTIFVVKWADQNIPAPNTNSGDPVHPVDPWIVLRIDSIVKVNEDYVGRPTDASTLVDIEGSRNFTLSIQGFGNGCIQELENIRTSLSRPSIKDTLRESDVVVRDTFYQVSMVLKWKREVM